ncbi:MAG: hypothetical protein U0525_03185 [Patescibacteria group bacterium]
MKLSKTFTTVTPLSKSIALGIFILFPFLGFIAGRQYQALVSIPQTQIVTQNVYKTQYLAPDPSYLDTERCGSFPNLPSSSVRNESQEVVGPIWSPDCRHIAWSTNSMNNNNKDNIKQKSNSIINIPSTEGDSSFGIYVYNDRTQKIQKIYIPKTKDETFFINEWSTSDNLIITINNIVKEYSINSDKIEIPE